jgi:hypothetical protein
MATLLIAWHGNGGDYALAAASIRQRLLAASSSMLG